MLHPMPIPAFLRWPDHETCVLGLVGSGRSLRRLYNDWRDLLMHTCRLLLGQNHSPRPLHQSVSFLVLECYLQHRVGHCNRHPSNASTQVPTSTQEAKIQSDPCVCSGWLVSILSVLSSCDHFVTGKALITPSQWMHYLDHPTAISVHRGAFNRLHLEQRRSGDLVVHRARRRDHLCMPPNAETASELLLSEAPAQQTANHRPTTAESATLDRKRHETHATHDS